VSVVYNSYWTSPAQSFSGPHPVRLATVFYCFRFETFVFFASTTRNATVEVFYPASTRDTHSAGLRSLLHSFSVDTTENTARQPSIVIMYGCLAIAGILLTCLPAFTKQKCSFPRSLHSNGTTCYSSSGTSLPNTYAWL
jgi:hypothetical protein